MQKVAKHPYLDQLLTQCIVMVYQLIGFFYLLRSPILLLRFIKLKILHISYSSCFKLKLEIAESGLDHDELSYGETCIMTVHSLFQKLQLSPNTSFMDLGCGMGRLCMYLHSRFGFRCTGVDIIPTFIQLAKKVAPKQCEFFNQNFMTLPLHDYHCVWVTCTCMSDPTREKLWKKMTELPSQAILITISYKAESPDFEMIHQNIGRFTWGPDTIYVQRKR